MISLTIFFSSPLFFIFGRLVALLAQGQQGFKKKKEDITEPKAVQSVV